VSARAAQVVDWMPQNDVLGHARTRVFLSQCGANSLYEARSRAPCDRLQAEWVQQLSK